MRLDQWLYEQGYFDSRERSRQQILAGRVRDAHSGQILDKPGMRPSKRQEVRIAEASAYVSRGGEKLKEFLSHFSKSPAGQVCLDIGSSTGGFTDCLLQEGAKQVVAIDVGTHQMHERLREHPQVELYENENIRFFDFDRLSAEPSWILIDVSFISVRVFFKRLLRRFPHAVFIVLYKPQFELGRSVRRKKGVVAEDERGRGLEEMLLFFRSLGLNSLMVHDSAVKGMKGNQESFLAMEAAFSQQIFRAYDIRGNAEEELVDPWIERIGFVLGKRLCRLKESPVVGLGRDARPSSPRIFQALARGLSVHPLRIVDYGECSTPMLYFASHQYQLDGAFQVTASHNPVEDNGIKMMLDGSALLGEEIRSIGEEAATVSLPTDLENVSFAQTAEEQLKKDYLAYLFEGFSFTHRYKVVVDCANGMGGKVARDVFTPYASELQILYEQPDGRFPNHPADPTVEKNLVDLVHQVQNNSADIGFAFDGDADRLGVVSASGRILWGDQILMLLAEKVLKDSPGATVIGEVKCSERLFQRIRQLGGEPLMYRTGHSLIKKKMKEVNAPIAGEMSGHLFFADRYFGFDDAVYAALRVLEAISEMDMSLDEWLDSFPPTFITPEVRLECQEHEKQSLVQSVADTFRSQEGVNLSFVDGVRVSFEDGAWVLVRASNTEAMLVLRAEAPSQERLAELQKALKDALGRPLS